MRLTIVAMALALMAGLTDSASAATLADSMEGWSFDGTQGDLGWFYGYYNLTRDESDSDGVYQPEDFIPFLNDDSLEVWEDNLNQWDGTQFRLYRDTVASAGQETGPWTRVSQAGGHPNGTNSAAPLLVDEPEVAEHWAIRRWVSDFSGEAAIFTNLSAANLAGPGTTIHLFHNGELIDTQTTNLGTGVTGTVCRSLVPGDILDLALSPEGVGGDRGDGSDGSNFGMRVSDEVSVELCTPPPPPIPALADSSDDWSETGTQGERNWYNGYYNLTADDDGEYAVDDFEPFVNLAGPDGGPVEPDGNHWRDNPKQWDLTPSGAPWTFIGPTGTHPNGINSAPNEEQWSIRRWVANDLTETTPLEVTWQTAKSNLAGDGVSAKLLINGAEVDSATIAGNDGIGVERKFYINANPGDVIDLALTPVGVTNDSDGSDGSINRLTIRDELPDGLLYNPGEKVADSRAEFSGVQGQDNWFFGYYDLRADAEDGDGVYSVDEFIPFLNDGSDVVSDDPEFGGWMDSENHWNGSRWDLLDNSFADTGHGPWTELNPGNGHPAANAQGDSEVHWTIQRWVSEESGEFLVRGMVNNVNAAGDGTVGRILIDGEEVWSALTNGSVADFDVMVSLLEGSIVDFVIDPDGTGVYDPADPLTVNDILDGSDGTNFWFTVNAAVLFSSGSGVAGDFDGDGLLTANDIDLLSTAVRENSMESRYDVNSDGAVDQLDRIYWVDDLKKTYFGDANLDGVFTTDDLVSVFVAGEYEDGVAGNSTWATGDWDGDTEFDSADFVAAFSAGGYELGPREAVSAVPEPSSVLMLSSALLLLGLRRREAK